MKYARGAQTRGMGIAAAACGLISAIAIPNSATSACPATLEYLATKLPNYSDPDLQRLRQAVLSTDLQQVLQTARSQGYTPQKAAAAALEQARQSEAAMPRAESCIRAAAANPQAVMAALKSGVFIFGQSISSLCAKSYVLAYYEMVGTRETAIGISCWASQGSSSR